MQPCENLVGLIWPMGSSLLICELLEGIKKPEIISVGKDVEKLQLLCIVSGDVNDAAAVENSMVIPQKIKKKTELLYDPKFHFGVYT